MTHDSDAWQVRLPSALQELVVPPARVEAHHDAAVPASKWRGYDAQGCLCWYRHCFAQRDAALDDEDRPIVLLLRAEDFEAWRSRAGTWVRRVRAIVGDGREDGLLEDSGYEPVESGEVPSG